MFYAVFSSVLTARYKAIGHQLTKQVTTSPSEALLSPLLDKLSQGAAALQATGSVESKAVLDDFLEAGFPFHYLILSDSILVYSDHVDENSDKSEIFREFVEFVRFLIAYAFTRKLLLRGAISFGEFYVDEENSIFFGKAFLKAVKLEKRQNWIGCALSEELDDLVAEYISTRHPQVPREAVLGLRNFGPLTGHVINRYPVPTHSGNSFQSYIVNWYPLLLSKIQLNDGFFDEELTGVESIDIKYENTLAYMKWWQSVLESLFQR